MRFLYIVFTCVSLLIGQVDTTLFAIAADMSDARSERVERAVIKSRENMPKVREKIAEVRAQMPKIRETVKNLPPEARMTRFERFKHKKIAAPEVVVKTVDVPITKDSTDDEIRVDWSERDNKIKRVPFTVGLDIRGKHFLDAGCLGAAYGIDYLRYKQLKKIDQDVLIKKLLEHRDELLQQLQALSFQKKDKHHSSFTDKIRRLFGIAPIKPTGMPDYNNAFKSYKKTILEKCIRPSLLSYKEQLPRALTYMASQEALMFIHDKLLQKDATDQANKPNIEQMMGGVHAAASFLSGRYSDICRTYNRKENKVVIPADALLKLAALGSYEFYFGNSYEANKNSLSKWILRIAYSANNDGGLDYNKILKSLPWLNSYWFYFFKKMAMNGRFLQQSNVHYEELIMNYCARNSKKLIQLLQGVNEEGQPVPLQRNDLLAFVIDAQKESFKDWRLFKCNSLTQTALLYELVTLLPAVPKLYKLFSSLSEFFRTDY